MVNRRLNVPRRDYDELKAVLHDAVRHGPATANRAGVADFRAHLLGRLAWVASLHPERGRRLRERFDAIRPRGGPAAESQSGGREPVERHGDQSSGTGGQSRSSLPAPRIDKLCGATMRE